MVGIAPSAASAPRSVLFVWRYPAAEGYTGIALYHAPSQSELVAGQNLTRVDLGRPAESDGVASLWVADFDDRRDYHVALRSYDAQGRESAYSNASFIRATADPETLHAEGFESYRGGQDPDHWLDTASGSTQPGLAALFETIELGDGSIAFGTNSAEADIHSHFADSDSRHWASYEYTGRMRSDGLVGESGVTFLSEFPDASSYYRLARSGAGAYTLSARGSTELRCAASTSSGVAALAGAWTRFQVRVTRFSGRNRIRAKVWRDGSGAPAEWPIDCWDRLPRNAASGRIGVYSSNGAGNFWDDLQLISVADDGAPPAYVPEQPPTPPPPPPPPAGAYTSAARLVHWWHPGRDAAEFGRDFAAGAAPIDVAEFKKGVTSRDFTAPGSRDAFVSLDGRKESFGNRAPQSYGLGDSWSFAIWVRPDVLPKKRARTLLDLKSAKAKAVENRISLTFGVDGRFAIEVTDTAARSRSVSTAYPVSTWELGARWYHVAVVKSGDDSLALYVDGELAGHADVAVPVQKDAPRVLRVGTRATGGRGHFFAGALHSIGLWNTALRATEVRALYGKGDWSLSLR
jgi:hypothetical protein